MKLTTYQAKDVRSAMKLVKKEQGDDAIILSTQDVPGGVEVVVALENFNRVEKEHRIDTREDTDINLFQDMDNKPIPNYKPNKKSTRNRKERGDTSSKDTSSTVDALSLEVKEIRALLESQLSNYAWEDMQENEPKKVLLYKKLSKLGVSWGLCESLIQSTKNKNWTGVLQSIEKKVRLEEDDMIEEGGVFALIGPTGVGKTTSLAKIASRFVETNDEEDIALITTDCYKIGAKEQLQSFSSLIDVDFYTAQSIDELEDTLEELAHKKLVLIDTAGMSQRAIRLSQQLTAKNKIKKEIKNILTISAASQYSVLKEVVDAFKDIGIDRCIVTKIDESTSLGPVLSVLVEERIPLQYTCEGQRVPEDIEFPNKHAFIESVLSIAQYTPAAKDEAFRFGLKENAFNAN